jgi:hypothetical protein
MADFYTNYPAPQKPMTLGEMLNMASGVQQYQQAQQMNPLALQRAQQEVEQARQINPLALRQKQAETTLAEDTLQPKIQQQQTITEKGQFEFESKKADKSREIISALAQSPAFRSGNRNEMIKELSDTHEELLRSKIPPQEALLAMSALTSKVMQDPKSAVLFLENYVRQSVSPESRLSLQTPQLTIQAGAPATFTSGTSTLAPANIAGQPPMPQQPQQVMPQQGVPQGMPQQPPQQAPQQPPQGVTPTQMSLQYPVRRAGDIRPLAPNEAVDTEKGVAYRNALTTRQTDLAASRRNLDEVIQQAAQISKEDLFSSGVLGAVTRTVKGWAGDPKYKQLSKDLANVQISNIQAQGGSLDTVAGQHLTKMANGDETYPPDVLTNIARRTYADLTNLDMQATAASKFAQKYGDSNLNSFKRTWSSNADSKVFEAMSIFENVKDPKKAKEEIDKLLGDNPQQRQQFFNKYNNIKKLTATGEL